PGQVVQIGQAVLDYTPAGQSAQAEAPAPAETKAAPAPAPVAAPTPNGATASRAPLSVRAAPSVRQMARKLGIDLTAVSGSGPEGRWWIESLRRDVRPPARNRPPAPTRPEPAFDYGTPGTRVKLQGVRRAIADRMVQSTKTIPHYSYIDECDVTDLVRLRA